MGKSVVAQSQRKIINRISMDTLEKVHLPIQLGFSTHSPWLLFYFWEDFLLNFDVFFDFLFIDIDVRMGV